MYAKIALNFLLIIILAALQLSFVSGLPMGLNRLNLILISFVLILAVGGFNSAIFVGLGLGVLADIFSFLPFGTYLISFSLTISAVNFLLVNFFTNKSLYSFLALIFFSTIIYETILSLYVFITSSFFAGTNGIIINNYFWSAELKGLILNILGTFILFYFLNFVSKSLKPVFLIRGGK